MNIAEQLDAALLEVTRAESALEIVLSELQAGPRAEKVTVTEKVAEAFSRLRAARVALSTIRDEVARDSVT